MINLEVHNSIGTCDNEIKFTRIMEFRIMRYIYNIFKSNEILVELEYFNIFI